MEQINDFFSFFNSFMAHAYQAAASFINTLSQSLSFLVVQLLLITLSIILIYYALLFVVGLISPSVRHSIHNWVTNVLPEYLFSIRITSGLFMLVVTLYEEISNVIVGICNVVGTIIKLVSRLFLIPVNWLSSKVLSITSTVSRTLDEIQSAHEKERAEEQERRYNEEKKQAEYRARRRTLKRMAKLERAKRTADAGKEYQPPNT